MKNVNMSLLFAFECDGKTKIGRVMYNNACVDAMKSLVKGLSVADIKRMSGVSVPMSSVSQIVVSAMGASKVLFKRVIKINK